MAAGLEGGLCKMRPWCIVPPLALLLDMLLGDPPNNLHPVAAMGAYIRWAARRAPQGSPAGRMRHGAALVVVGCVALAGLMAGAVRMLRHGPGSGGWAPILFEALLLKAVLSLRGLLMRGAQVERALKAGHLEAARRLVGRHLVGRATETLPAPGVASATLESLAENLSDSVIAPLLAYQMGGLPLAWVYRFVNTADAMIGYRHPPYAQLGRFAARLDDALNWLPSRLTGLCLVAAAPLVAGRAQGAWRVMLRDHRLPASPNAGWPMAAAAGALGVRLEKPGHYRLGGGLGPPQSRDITRGRRLVLLGALIGLGVSVAAGAALHRR